MIIILHTHLPHVLTHGKWPHGSDWLFEATAECYLPLLAMCRRLMNDGVRPGLTFDISPILCEQLSHPTFASAFKDYCLEQAALAEGDTAVLEAEGASAEILTMCKYWSEWYRHRESDFQDFGGDIVGALRALQDKGAIEVMTCAATHGYLPLMAEDRSIRLQVRLARANYTRHFGRQPRGIWLPECAYRPAYPWRTLLPVAAYAMARIREGLEDVLSEEHLEYFVTDEHALSRATPLGNIGPDGHRTPMEETYGAVRQTLDNLSPFNIYRITSPTSRSSVAAFTRHSAIAMQVWSGQTGYPADPDYLDFHKKFYRSSLRYWRVTDVKADMLYKQPYVPEWAAGKAATHAEHYVKIMETAVLHQQSTNSGATPVLTLPFDTELFGHWWFEGPTFLEHVIRGASQSTILNPVTASEALDATVSSAAIALPESSWGKNGTHEVWMNDDTKWTWERLYLLERRMSLLFDKHAWVEKQDELFDRIIKAALIQLLLAQASDWQFLISTFSAREYAVMRFHAHADECLSLCDMAERRTVGIKMTQQDMDRLQGVESRDAIFPELQPAWFS